MSLQTDSQPKPAVPSWVWPAGFIIIVLAVVILSGLHEEQGPHGEHLIRSDSEYQDILVRARSLSEKPLVAFDAGQPLSNDELQNVRESAKLFEELSLYRPDKMAPPFGAARCHLMLGENQTAEEDFHQCIANVRNESNPQNFKNVSALEAEAHYFLGQCYILDHKYQQAKNETDIALTSRPNIPNYLIVRARAEIQLNELKQAEFDLQSVKVLDPKNPHVPMLLDFLSHAHK
jgi:tetratricopeptide (TPR) repeat protein